MDKTFLEFFAGIGLMRMGLEPSGWRCVYANDVDASKKEMYEKQFTADHFHLADVWETDAVAAAIPRPAFLATASFPCVDLSLAGRWKGFAGEHSSAFFGFVRALARLGDARPPLVLIENVGGFLSSHGGRDFATAVTSLANLGYWLDAFVLDARWFLPQSRARVFLVGVQDEALPKTASRQSTDDRFANDWPTALGRRSVHLRPAKLAALMASIPLATGWTAFDLPSPPAVCLNLADKIDFDEGQSWWEEPAVAKHLGMMSEAHRRQVHERLERGGTVVGTIFRRKRQGTTRAEVRFDGLAGCLRTPRGGSARQIVIVLSDGRIRMRWMSAVEYARLQGADDYPLMRTAQQNLFGFGDAVCVPVVEWIDRSILSPVFKVSRAKTMQNDGRQPNP